MEFLIGLAVGYVVVSLCESLFHRTIQHAPARRRAFWNKLGPPGRALIRSWYGHHVVHHHLTFRSSHVAQFSCRAEKSKLDSFLISKDRQHVIAESYGTRIGPRLWDFLLYVAPTLLPFVTICWLGGAVFICGALVPFIVWPALSQFVHPYLHVEYWRISTEAPAIIKLLSQTPYFRFVAIHHWLHHRYETCNYNLLLGGDMLWGVHRAPSAGDLAEMRAIGLWTPPTFVPAPEFD